MLTLLIPRSVKTSFAMSLLTKHVGTAFTNPWDHAAAAEAIAAMALSVAALFGFNSGIAARARLEEIAGLLLCGSVEFGLAGVVFFARFVDMFGTIAVDADLKAAGAANEDATLFFAIEGLAERGAARHADDSGLQLLSVP